MKCGECSSAITAQEKVKYACPKCNVQLTARKPNSCRECGHKITSEVIKNGNWYIYYHCTKKKGKCAQKYVREEVLEEQITDNLKNIEIDPDFEEWAIEWMKYLHQENSHVNDKQLETLQKNYKRSQKRLDQLFEMRLDREISPEEYEPKKKAFEVDRDELLQQINNLKENSDEYLNDAEKELVCGIMERFRNGTLKERKYIFAEIGSNFILKDSELSLEVHNPYIEFKNLRSHAPARLEPPKTLCEKGLMVDLKRSHPIWLQRLECICRYFAFDKGAFCSNLRLEERMTKKTDEWVMG